MASLLTAGGLTLDANHAEACKVASPPSYEPGAGSADAPPAVQIEGISVSLGRNYGQPGPGDCSELGTVVLELASADGALLDGRFGARINVVAGNLPVVLADLAGWVAPIEDNRIHLGIKDDKRVVDFTVTVQAVNASGTLGAESAPVRRSAQVGGGCQMAGAGAPPLWMLPGAFGLVLALGRRRGAPRAPRPGGG